MLNDFSDKASLSGRCLLFGIAVIKFCEKLPQKRANWIIADQIIRSSTSIGANIVEARASSSRIEFKKFYEIALKSSNETLYWLEMLKELKTEDKADLLKIIDEAIEINKMVAGAVIKLKAKKL